jgi:hypothetical protein
VVEHVGGHEDSKVERWELKMGNKARFYVLEEEGKREERGNGSAYVVVDVGHAAHDHERCCVGAII